MSDALNKRYLRSLQYMNVFSLMYFLMEDVGISRIILFITAVLLARSLDDKPLSPVHCRKPNKISAHEKIICSLIIRGGAITKKGGAYMQNVLLFGSVVADPHTSRNSAAVYFRSKGFQDSRFLEPDLLFKG